MVRYLADEHIPKLVVMTLRDQGHDVTWAAETGAQGSDASHLRHAEAENRILLTEDSDFSTLVSGTTFQTPLIYFRLDGLGRASKFQRMLEAIAAIGEASAGTTFVVDPSRIRSRRHDNTGHP